MKHIKIKNAYLHNLQNVSVEIPKKKLVVVTGVSGSGKSSLITDIVDKVGCCEYLECLGVPQDTTIHNYYESISGLNPTISVKSANENRWNPRSLVGTKTGLINYLRLLFLSEGTITCRKCGMTNKLNQRVCNCGENVPSIDSRELSFFSSIGKCPKCNGKGYLIDVDFTVFRNHDEMTLPDLCCLIPECKPLKNQLSFFAEALKVDLKIPFSQQSIDVQESFLHGMQSEKSNFRGIGPYLEKLYSENKYNGDLLFKCTCPECNGERINAKGRSIKIQNFSLKELSTVTLNHLYTFVTDLSENEATTVLGKSICKILMDKLNDFKMIGLGYLSLYRTIPSLSGGEYQRLKLATLLKSTMEELVIIADEPLTGLHPEEKIEVLNQMRLLCDRGNTVIMIEHNLEAIKRADYVIDFGPFGGKKGGNILYCGSYEGLLECKDSLTAKFIGRINEKIKLPVCRQSEIDYLMIKHARVNNLKDIDVKIPLHKLVGITGVSGSGKSSLISKALVPLLKEHFRGSGNEENENEEDEIAEKFMDTTLNGASHVSGYVYVSQYPIGRNSRSTLATYIGLMKCLNTIFHKLEKESEFNISTEVRYKDKTLEEILCLNVMEALGFFQTEKKIHKILLELEALGLGYLTLGQPTPTLSTGEAQRVKLARSLLDNKENLLYLFDEPTIGLGLYDIFNLRKIFQRLIEKGHSVIVIEHDIVVLSSCHWIIEMGPGSDSLGGEVIAEGIPDEIRNNANSKIGKYILK